MKHSGEEQYYQQAKRQSIWLALVKSPVFWIIVVLLLIIGIDYQTTASDASNKMTQMNKDYAIAWIRLGQYYTNGENAAKVAQTDRQSFEKILTDVLKAKYGNGQALNASSNSVYTIIAKAYPNDPDIKSEADAYKALRDILVGGYNDFSAQEERLQNDIQDFNNWRYAGDGNWLERPFLGGYPNDELQTQYAPGAAHYYYGKQALDQMSQIIADPNVATSYQTGTLQPITIPTP